MFLILQTDKELSQQSLSLGAIHIDPYSAKLNNLNFHPLEVVSRYRDPQLQVAENINY